MMSEPLSMKYIHKPARSKELINEKSLNYKLTKNSQYNRANESLDSNHNENEDPRTSSNAFDQFNAFQQQHNKRESPVPPSATQEIKHSDDEDKDGQERNDYFGNKLVRKKSGEVLKSSLKDKYISKSLPTTPNSKQVHFGTEFDIKFFNKKDKPNAISASNSPTLQSPDLNSMDFSDDEPETSDSDFSEFSDDDISHGHGGDFGFRLHGTTNYPNPKHNKLIDWKLKIVNFSNEINYNNYFSKQAPIFLERVFISIDKKYLLGHIAVKNLSFEKSVNLKYTFNNWSTIIEIPSIYVPDFPKFLKDQNYDRFIFKIPLNDLFINKSNSFYQENNFKFCLVYKNNQGEFWDNNNFQNFEINIVKIIKNDNYNNNVNHSNGFSGASLNPYNSYHSNSFNSSFDHYTHNNQHNSYNNNHNNNNNSNTKSFANNTLSPRPKYSNTYLKRINSDSQLDIDYVKNNYYLSSPLLSSFKYYQEHDNSSTDTLKFNPDKDNLNYLNDSTGTKDKSKDSSSDIDNFKLNNMEINSKSYKDLIDNYCFFNSDKKDEDTFSVQSLLGT